jgi:hypothetical protein
MAFRERAGRLIRRLLREIQYRDSENVTLVEGIIGTIAGFYTSAYGMNFIEEHTGIYPLDFNMNDFRARGILDAINRDPNVDLINFIGLIPAIIFFIPGFLAAREIIMSPGNLRRLAITIRRIFTSPDIRDDRYVEEIHEHIDLFLDSNAVIRGRSNVREILRVGFINVRERGINALIELRDSLFTNNDYDENERDIALEVLIRRYENVMNMERDRAIRLREDFADQIRRDNMSNDSRISQVRQAAQERKEREEKEREEKGIEHDNCAVCYDNQVTDGSNGSGPWIAPWICGHEIHKQCVNRLLMHDRGRRQPRCPLCQEEVLQMPLNREGLIAFEKTVKSRKYISSEMLSLAEELDNIADMLQFTKSTKRVQTQLFKIVNLVIMKTLLEMSAIREIPIRVSSHQFIKIINQVYGRSSKIPEMDKKTQRCNLKSSRKCK